jgi:hypothetical protein
VFPPFHSFVGYVYTRTCITPKRVAVRKFSVQISFGFAAEKNVTFTEEGRREEKQTAGIEEKKNAGVVAEVNIVMDVIRFISGSYCR